MSFPLGHASSKVGRIQEAGQSDELDVFPADKGTYGEKNGKPVFDNRPGVTIGWNTRFFLYTKDIQLLD